MALPAVNSLGAAGEWSLGRTPAPVIERGKYTDVDGEGEGSARV